MTRTGFDQLPIPGLDVCAAEKPLKASKPKKHKPTKPFTKEDVEKAIALLGALSLSDNLPQASLAASILTFKGRK